MHPSTEFTSFGNVVYSKLIVKLLLMLHKGVNTPSICFTTNTDYVT